MLENISNCLSRQDLISLATKAYFESILGSKEREWRYRTFVHPPPPFAIDDSHEKTRLKALATVTLTPGGYESAIAPTKFYISCGKCVVNGFIRHILLKKNSIHFLRSFAD